MKAVRKVDFLGAFTLLAASILFVTAIEEGGTEYPWKSAVVVNDLSAFDAGWRLLALMLCSPLGSALSGYLVSKAKVPPFYLFLVAAVLQIIGLALMGTLSVTSSAVPRAQYGYQVILGLGIGLTLSSLLIAAPTVIESKDTAVFIGGLTQARILGGSIGVAVCTNVLNNKVKTASSFLSSEQLHGLLESAQTLRLLSPDLQKTVRQVYGKG
ncbi:MAG: hypothetical protein LQ349_007112 [Xanthoria aureola]|nr:MAG: hypothetical protein LQ349_007112 [Xanthoria aureola]